MADDQKQRNSEKKSRRFRIGRKVKPQETPPLSREEQEMKALAEMGEEADRGTEAMQQWTNKGCKGCLNITLLVFVIMIASIIGTCYIRRPAP